MRYLMAFYIQIDAEGEGIGVWEIVPAHARRIDGAQVSHDAMGDMDANSGGCMACGRGAD
jgi:hypothetical protein